MASVPQATLMKPGAMAAPPLSPADAKSQTSPATAGPPAAKHSEMATDRTRRLRRGAILLAGFIAGISMEGWVGSAGGAGRPRTDASRRDGRLVLEGTTGTTGPEPSTDAWHRSPVCAGPGVG